MPAQKSPKSVSPVEKRVIATKSKVAVKTSTKVPAKAAGKPAAAKTATTPLKKAPSVPATKTASPIATEIVARTCSNGDEVIVARCDLDLGRSYRDTTFNFGKHRRTEHYGMIVERTRAQVP